RGVHTVTCSTVVGGLRAAANFADVFGEGEKAAQYRIAADEIVAAMREHLYNAELGRFVRGLTANGDDSLTPDSTVDASLFGLFYFGSFDVDDPMVAGTMNAVMDRLSNGGFGGIARYENDGYMRVAESGPGNSWFVCTLWLAEYYIAKARTPYDLQPALDVLQWAVDRALPSGVLAEQVDPVTGKEMSVSPLTWSHSTFVAAVHSYLLRLGELRR